MLKPNGLPPSPTSAFRRAGTLSPEWDEVLYRPLLSNLAVAPEYRRRGVARRLMEVAERTAEETMGFEELLLKVEHKNMPALELYRALGYRETAQAKIVEDRFVPLAHLANKSTGCGAAPAAGCSAEAEGVGVLASGRAAVVLTEDSVSSDAVSASETMTSRGVQVCYDNDEPRAPRQTGTWEPTTNICLRKDLGIANMGGGGDRGSTRGPRGRLDL